MSEENVEVVRTALDLFNAFMRGELPAEAVAEHEIADPQLELVWHAGQTFPDAPQHVHGVREFLGLWEQYRGAFVDLVQEPLELIEASGDLVLTPIRQTGRGRESGVPVEIHFFCIWTILDGRVHRMELFRHRSDALEAAGLSEYLGSGVLRHGLLL